MQLLHSICKEENTAVLMITHNEQWLTTFPGREFLCKDKKLVENTKASTEEAEAETEEQETAAQESAAQETIE
jgi:ABC-type lipoprotein export system ATPase subunit